MRRHRHRRQRRRRDVRRGESTGRWRRHGRRGRMMTHRRSRCRRRRRRWHDHSMMHHVMLRMMSGLVGVRVRRWHRRRRQRWCVREQLMRPVCLTQRILRGQKPFGGTAVSLALGVAFKSIRHGDRPIAQILTVHRFDTGIRGIERGKINESEAFRIACFGIPHYLHNENTYLVILFIYIWAVKEKMVT